MTTVGKNLKLNLEDESGKLTLNTSQFYIKNNMLNIGINLRIPVHTTIDAVISRFEECFSKPYVSVISKMDSLFIEKDNVLVNKLCSIFNEACGTNFEPIAIGGATYARAFENCISFGANFPGQKDMCHQTDEFISIDSLILSSKIYAEAIKELS